MSVKGGFQLSQSTMPLSRSSVESTSDNEKALDRLGFNIAADATNNWSAIQLDRKTTLNKICLKYNLTRSTNIFRNVGKQLYVEHNHKIIYCEVPKAGCSNWKRILILLHMNLSREPDEIDHEAVHLKSPVKTLISYPQHQWMKYLNTYTKVMFTRDPLERLVSAYRNKFLHSYMNPYYSGYVADKIRKQFRISRTPKTNITFLEFVRFVLQENPAESDLHWREMNKLCDPCNIQYDIIGKLTTLHEDASHVLKIIKAPKNLYFSSAQQYPGEALTDEKITKDYLKNLSHEYIQELIKQYKLDFCLFNYSFNISSF
ncbi:carbohydrate sulfotransferase 9-like [Pleurodeles waltl]|uniref:carbohydrate sulfotransferase 9-like n=1 Tax=Pleurodeles waltl TaxID=8319 RepID=UPI0037098A13